MEIGQNFGISKEQAVLFQTRQHVRNTRGNGHWLRCSECLLGAYSVEKLLICSWSKNIRLVENV